MTEAVITDRVTAAQSAKALVALVLGAIAIGAAPILVRLAETAGVGPSAAGFWRLALALPLLAAWVSVNRTKTVVSKETRAAARAAGWRMAALAGVLFAGDLGTWHFGILHTTAANAALLPNLTPVFITAVAWLVFKETINSIFLIGLATALAGVVMLSSAGVRANPDQLLGDALCVLTAVWYAGYLLAVKAGRNYWSAGDIMLISSAIGAPFLFVLALGFGESFLPEQNVGWLWLGLLAFIHAAGQGGIAYGIGQLPATLSSVVVLVQPISAAILGWAIYSERLGPIEVVGATITLAGILTARYGASRLAQTNQSPMSSP